MNTDYFLKDANIQKTAKRAEELKNSGKRFSDIVDDTGLQYVDLVQEGGGVLGIALVGYTYVLEKAGIRFFNLAGASAGAINTLLIASIEGIEKEKSEKILSALSEQNLFDFVDGSKKIKGLVKRYVNNKSLFWTALFNLMHLKKKIVGRMGLNYGAAFEYWIKTRIKKEGITTLSDLTKRQKSFPELYNISGGEPVKQNYDKTKIAIIATDATTKTKVDFPRMSGLYWESEDVNPASFVRASMSIPFFFEPFTVKDIPDKGKKNVKQWDEFAGYKGIVPDEIKFVDGGLLSNFPINTFHLKGVPKKPTFGVRLSAYRVEAADTKTFGGFISGMFDAVRQQFDFDFLYTHPDYQHLICSIDADKTYNWLDFNISDKNKLGLFKLGAQKAIDFLEKFDWEEYKNVRRKSTN